jgi:hypothetical protein
VRAKVYRTSGCYSLVTTVFTAKGTGKRSESTCPRYKYVTHQRRCAKKSLEPEGTVELFVSHLLRVTKHLKHDLAWTLLNTQLTSLSVLSNLELSCLTVEARRQRS